VCPQIPSWCFQGWQQELRGWQRLRGMRGMRAFKQSRQQQPEPSSAIKKYVNRLLFLLGTQG